MPRTLTLMNVDDDLVEKLSDRAMRHGRSIEAEHRAILDEALTRQMSFEERASKLRDQLAGRHHTPAEVLQRESRDER